MVLGCGSTGLVAWQNAFHLMLIGSLHHLTSFMFFGSAEMVV